MWLHFTKINAGNAHCNKCKAAKGNTSNPRKHMSHKIYLKAEECTIFDCRREKSFAPAIGTVANVSKPAASDLQAASVASPPVAGVAGETEDDNNGA